jgi:hypothetical protein
VAFDDEAGVAPGFGAVEQATIARMLPVNIKMLKNLLKWRNIGALP